jgi:hypothetical protein
MTGGGGFAGRLPTTRRRWSGSKAARRRGASVATRSGACGRPWPSGHASRAHGGGLAAATARRSSSATER